MIKAVVFDLDNTLYDYDYCNSFAERKLFELIISEFHVSMEDAQKMLKNAKNYVKSNLGDGVAASHNRLLYMQNICEQTGKNPLIYAMKLYDEYWNTMLEKMVPYEYVAKLFDDLKSRGILIGILTDLTAHIQYRKLSVLGLNDKIDYLVTSEEAGAEKPSKKMFELMLKKMQIAPEEALMIGDSQAKDIDGAMNAGMHSLIFSKQPDVIAQISDLIKSVE